LARWPVASRRKSKTRNVIAAHRNALRQGFPKIRQCRYKYTPILGVLAAAKRPLQFFTTWMMAQRWIKTIAINLSLPKTPSVLA
jgi:hypothetical protein